LIAARKMRAGSSILGRAAVVAPAFALAHFVTIAGAQTSAELHWSLAWPAVAPSPVYGVAIVSASLCLQAIGACALVMSAFGEQKALLRLRAATNAMPSALALFDAADRLVAWNRVFERIMGPDADQVREGMPYALLNKATPEAAMELNVDPAARAPRQRRHAEFMAGGRWIRVDHIPTEDGGLLSLGSDITDIRKAQDALAEALERVEAG